MHLSLFAWAVLNLASGAPGASDDYCTYVEAVASSEAALLSAPELFAAFGALNEPSVFGTSTFFGLTPATRLIGGLRFELMGLTRGALLGGRAAQECERYQAESGLHGFLDWARSVARRGLVARLETLTAAEPHGLKLLAEAKRDLEAGQTTVSTLNAVQLRMAELQRLMTDTRRDLASLPVATPPRSSLARLRARHLQAVGLLEEVNGALRRSRAFELGLRAGYDRSFPGREGLPLFGMVTVSLNLGLLGQGGPDGRAIEAFRRWRPRALEGVEERLDAELRRLEAEAEVERARLGEVKVLLADIERRMQSLETFRGKEIQSFRDYLWFERVKLKSEHAYLTARAEDLTLFFSRVRD